MKTYIEIREKTNYTVYVLGRPYAITGAEQLSLFDISDELAEQV